MQKLHNILKLRLILLGILFGCIYLLYYLDLNTIGLNQLRILGGFALLQLVYIFWSWHKLTGRYIDAYLIFMIACYAFNLAQPIMEVFDCVSLERSLLTHYHWPLNDYCRSTVISMSFILCFHFGGILAVSHNTNKNLESPDRKYALQLQAIKSVATPLAVLSFPFYMYNTMIMVVVSMTMGYGAIYEGDIGTNTLFKLIGDFYVPSLICLFFVSQATRRRVWFIAIITVVTVVVPPLLIGGRSNAIIILAILFIVYSFFHKLTFRRLVVVGISIYFIFIIFAAIAGSRGGTNRSISSMFEQDKGTSNSALFTLSEMGGSMQPLLNCINILPDRVEYKYGESYLYSFTTLVPNLGFWEVHPATEKANLGNWLQKYLNLSYGPGFSIIAEAYYNFGYFGCLMMLVLGLGFTKIYRLVSKSELVRNPMAFIIAIIFLYFTIALVRNSFEFAVRALFYYCLPMYWLMRQSYLKRIKSNKRYEHKRSETVNRIANKQ